MRNKDKHARTKLAFKISGICFIIAGAALAITGFASFFMSFGSGKIPQYFWCTFVGLPLLAVGIGLSSFGFRREITGYVKDETVPVFNEAGRELAPAVSAISMAARGEKKNLCPVCGKENDEGAKFCRHCGTELLAECPNCGKKVKSGAFCSECGAKLR